MAVTVCNSTSFSDIIPSSFSIFNSSAVSCWLLNIRGLDIITFSTPLAPFDLLTAGYDVKTNSDHSPIVRLKLSDITIIDNFVMDCNITSVSKNLPIFIYVPPIRFIFWCCYAAARFQRASSFCNSKSINGHVFVKTLSGKQYSIVFYFY